MSWNVENNHLVKTFTFSSFAQAIAFMNHCLPAINELDHHPEWTNVYNELTCRLCTHSQGNIITHKDEKLAEIIDKLFMEFIKR